MRTIAFSFVFFLLVNSGNSQQLQWGVAIGGATFEMIQALEVDEEGNTFIVGQVASNDMDFDPSSNEALVPVEAG
ncbi:MAG: hypothetical protein AAF193_09275, partial [Bacteroidota bacterium]